jgi:hypothetical protein
LLLSLNSVRAIAPVNTAPQSITSTELVKKGNLPMPDTRITCGWRSGMSHTHCATLTDASWGVKRAVMLAAVPGASEPADGVSVKGPSHVHEKETGRSPELEMANVLTAVSLTGQKPKSRLSGTHVETVGIHARTGTTNEPLSFQNCTQSSYSSSFMGRKDTGIECDRPGMSWTVSGKAIEKYLDLGSLYRSFIALVVTFFTTSCFMYSPPGSQPAAHSRLSPQSTPKRRTRCARVSGLSGPTDANAALAVPVSAGSLSFTATMRPDCRNGACGATTSSHCGNDRRKTKHGGDTTKHGSAIPRWRSFLASR